jgi:hypothetical protein
LTLRCGANETRSFDKVITEIFAEDLDFWLFLAVTGVFCRQSWRKNCAN